MGAAATWLVGATGNAEAEPPSTERLKTAAKASGIFMSIPPDYWRSNNLQEQRFHKCGAVAWVPGIFLWSKRRSSLCEPCKHWWTNRDQMGPGNHCSITFSKLSRSSPLPASAAGGENLTRS